MRDLISNIGPAVSIAPDGNRTATTNGSGVDLKGYESAAVLFQFGTVTDGTWTPSVEESDDNITFTAVAAGDLLGTLSAVTSSTDEAIQKASYIGGKRYVAAVVTETVASTTGAKFSALVVRGHPHSVPVA
jgi:hypothetical protein